MIWENFLIVILIIDYKNKLLGKIKVVYIKVYLIKIFLSLV